MHIIETMETVENTLLLAVLVGLPKALSRAEQYYQGYGAEQHDKGQMGDYKLGQVLAKQAVALWVFPPPAAPPADTLQPPICTPTAERAAAASFVCASRTISWTDL